MIQLKQVPFYSNTADDTHCFQAVLKMVLKYFKPDENYSFQDLDKFSDKVKGNWTWSTRAAINLQQMGFSLVEISPFDWHKFIEEDYDYLVEFMGKEVADKQREMSDLAKEVLDAQEYIELIEFEKRIPEIDDIRSLLEKGYLVGCNVNSKALNQQDGYTGHSILIFNLDEENIYLHDPGLPSQKNRRVPISIFRKAWAYPYERNKNLTGFKLKESTPSE